MVNVRAFIQSLKLAWIKRLVQNNGEPKWQFLLLSQIDMNVLLNCGNKYIKICRNKFKNQFWKDVFLTWEFFCEKGNIQNNK